MLAVNRYTGEIDEGATFTFMNQHEQLYNILSEEDWEYLEVDPFNAKAISKLIQKGFTIYKAVSGVGEDLPHIVINNWRFDLIDRINKLLESNEDFKASYNKFVREIIITEEDVSKWVIDTDQDEYEPFHPEILAENDNLDFTDGAYSVKVTIIEFKFFNEDMNEDHSTEDSESDEFEKNMYYLKLWRWVYSIIDNIV